MSTLYFSDMLYGRIALPSWIEPFLKLPEFLRLRNVRLSNVDSYEFKDFNAPSRWEHAVGVAYLAHRCAQARRLTLRDTAHLILGALLHDIGTPPFGHTLEYVLAGYDHEYESNRLLVDIPTGMYAPPIPIFASQFPQFNSACKRLSERLRVEINPTEVSRIVSGESHLGFLVKGTLDLDNADNVIRACSHMGIKVDSSLPVQLADWLAKQDGIPNNIELAGADCVRQWIECRGQLYSSFFNSSEEELGRQAFLQHIMRRAWREGFDPLLLIWNTDDGVLRDISEYGQSVTCSHYYSLQELVDRYRLLERAYKIFEIPFYDDADARLFSSPDAVNWINSEVQSQSMECFAMYSKRRYLHVRQMQELLPPPKGSLQFYKLGSGYKIGQFPSWMIADIIPRMPKGDLSVALTVRMKNMCNQWKVERPWTMSSVQRDADVKKRLDYIKDWDFRLSRNDNLHSYPATFVHAIPRALITALGLREDLVLDPFGGTGQTAAEVLRLGGDAILSDNSSIACMVSRARFTYLGESSRKGLRGLSTDVLEDCSPVDPPIDDNLLRWYNSSTLDQLCRIKAYIDTCPHDEQLFLRACFSGILTSCTARRGKQHGFFADNTPLSRGEVSPPFYDAYALFMSKIAANITLLESLYSYIERDSRNPEDELKRVKVRRLSVEQSSPENYNVGRFSVGGVITSPPYLCMVDYVLGQRLSYMWLFPERMNDEYSTEIGARRQRFRPGEALSKYYASVDLFSERMAELVRAGGYVALVIGAPLAKAFADEPIDQYYDESFRRRGFKRLWETWRDVHWHRQHGYSRLKKERIVVYTH